MGNCCSCLESKKSRKNATPLMESVYNPSDRDRQAYTSGESNPSRDNHRSNIKEREDNKERRSSGDRDRDSESGARSSMNGRGGYNPPMASSSSSRIAIRKLSLSTCPAQIKNAKLVFPAPKYGEMKKLGHLIKNWKKRFFVLEGDRLQYYGIGKNNPDSSKFKGELSLEGATITDNSENRRLAISVHDTQMVLEFDQINKMMEWKFVLRECIRTANCNSLMKGQRVPDVVAWYNEQYTLYVNAASVLRAGEMFCLHHIDQRDGYVELIPLWLQETPSGLGFMMMCDHVTVHSTGPPTVGGADTTTPATAARTKIQGMDIPYNSITSIMTGSKIEVYHTPEMGGTNR